MSAVCVLGMVGRGVVKNDKEHAISILHQSRNYIKHFASQVVKTILSLLLATKYTQFCVDNFCMTMIRDMRVNFTLLQQSLHHHNFVWSSSLY